MKKVLSLLVIIIIAIGITACSKEAGESSNNPKDTANPEEIAEELYNKMLEEWENNNFDGFSELFTEGVSKDYIKAQYDYDWSKLTSDFKEQAISTLYSKDGIIASVLHFYTVDGAYTEDYSYAVKNIMLGFQYEKDQWKLTDNIGKEFTKYDLLSNEASTIPEENIYLAPLRNYNIFTGFVVPGALEVTVKEIYLGEDGSYHITITFSNGMKEAINFKDLSLEVNDITGQEIINVAEYPVNLLIEENSTSDFFISLPAPEGAGRLGEGIEWAISYEWE